jgi:hypothetical protein
MGVTVRSCRRIGEEKLYEVRKKVWTNMVEAAGVEPFGPQCRL